jgi:hypothetical protein
MHYFDVREESIYLLYHKNLITFQLFLEPTHRNAPQRGISQIMVHGKSASESPVSLLGSQFLNPIQNMLNQNLGYDT